MEDNEKVNGEDKMKVGEGNKDVEENEKVNGEDVTNVEDEGKKVVEENGAKTVNDQVGMNETKEAEDVKMEEAEGTIEEDVKEEEDDEKINKKEEEVEGVDTVNEKEVSGQSKKRRQNHMNSSSPLASSSERPMRERRTVERFFEVIDKAPVRKFQVEKGLGTPLKDIPHVAQKLAKNKPVDLKFLHQTLFGRRGKAINYKSHILQFSGFVWHENEEKQWAKLKDKLDKFVKGTLLDLCDLFDIPISKTTTKKKELVSKLLDFLAAPHATTDVIENEQSTKSKKHRTASKGSPSKNSDSMPTKKFRKNKIDGEETSSGKNVEETEDDDDKEEEDVDTDADDEDAGINNLGSDAKESESVEVCGEDCGEDKDGPKNSGEAKKDVDKSSKQHRSAGKEKMKMQNSPKKASVIVAKSPTKTSSKRSRADDGSDDAKVSSRKRKDACSPKKSTPKQDAKQKSAGKKGGKKAKSEEKDCGPSQKELREAICEILKEVDFNTATFTDILKQLAIRYKTDLTPRKKAIKLQIQEELTKLADEAEENEDEEGDDGENRNAAGEELIKA